MDNAARRARLVGLFVKYALRPALKIVAVAILLFFTVLLVWAFDARGMPDLEAWNTASLDAEFRAGDDRPGLDLAGYLKMEEALFKELETEVLKEVEPTPILTLSRYSADGPNNPVRFPTNWNRSFELVPDEIRGGALLLHGLTDSPYSLRLMAELLRDEGYYVLALRLPGHGTAPAGLRRIKWKDWMAATRLGARHVHGMVNGRGPVVVVGYSNGGGLAVKYTLEAIEDPDLAVPDRLILFSPAIGITRFAALARWHKVLSWIPYFEKSAWMSIEPEIDPFKYNSFPKNAGYQTHLLTGDVRAHFDRIKRAGRAAEIPPILAFQSLVDTTVLTDAIVNGLFNGLEGDGHELVLFDVNRVALFKYLFVSDHRQLLDRLESGGELPYTLTVITNINEESLAAQERKTPPRSRESISTGLGLEWPVTVYSLSHIAIPFSPDDPIYGGQLHLDLEWGVPLGALEPRGERKLLRISEAQFMRLRHNPFFDYVERRVRETVAP
ncbi:MAG: alpha/beta hydrolase [Planctomycetota bacterium]|jgi:alpha-beta hydrolase superfamily lysophospholipase